MIYVVFPSMISIKCQNIRTNVTSRLAVFWLREMKQQNTIAQDQILTFQKTLSKSLFLNESIKIQLHPK